MSKDTADKVLESYVGEVLGSLGDYVKQNKDVCWVNQTQFFSQRFGHSCKVSSYFKRISNFSKFQANRKVVKSWSHM